MARTGRPRKREVARQGHRQYEERPQLAVVPRSDAEPADVEPIPMPPTRADEKPLGVRALLLWDAFWDSKVHGAVDLRSDWRQLSQLFRDIDEIERLQVVIAEEPLVEGSQGQPRQNPLMAREEALEARIRQAEEKFGMTPQDRERLGLVAGQRRLTVDELNKRVRGTSELNKRARGGGP